MNSVLKANETFFAIFKKKKIIPRFKPFNIFRTCLTDFFTFETLKISKITKIKMLWVVTCFQLSSHTYLI